MNQLQNWLGGGGVLSLITSLFPHNFSFKYAKITLTWILTGSYLYLIDMGFEGQA